MQNFIAVSLYLSIFEICSCVQPKKAQADISNKDLKSPHVSTAEIETQSSENLEGVTQAQASASQEDGKDFPSLPEVPFRAGCPEESFLCLKESDIEFRFLTRRFDQEALIEGSFDKIIGHVKAGENSLEGVIDFDTRSVNTHEELRDQRLSDHFFVSNQFPNIRFRFSADHTMVGQNESATIPVHGELSIWQESIELNFEIQVTRTASWVTIVPLNELIIPFEDLSIAEGITYLEDFCACEVLPEVKVEFLIRKQMDESDFGESQSKIQ